MRSRLELQLRDTRFPLLAMRFPCILFYRINTLSISTISAALRRLKIKYLYVSKVTWYGRKTLYLKGASLVIFTDDILVVNKVQALDLGLYLLSINRYFLNIGSLQLSDLCIYFNFYNQNYFFIIQYLLYFYRIWILLVLHVGCQLILQLYALKNMLV